MSESKRFSWKTEKLQHSDDEVLMVVDNENKDWKGHILNIVDKLNELSEANDNCRNDYRELFSNYVTLEEENEQLRQFINKGRRLSVKEIMGNANENVKLRAKIGEQQATIEAKDKEINELKSLLKKCSENWKQEIIKRGHLEEEIIRNEMEG